MRMSRVYGEENEKLTFTASKLMSESTAKVAPLLSAALASLRNFVLDDKLSQWDVRLRSHLHAVVVTVNQEYRPIVITVTAAKSQPNFQDCEISC